MKVFAVWKPGAPLIFLLNWLWEIPGDKDLVYKVGRITGEEGRAMGYTNVYAPILDVARDQRWGRLEESYGEAPYLVERLGVEMAEGMQKDHTVVFHCKHYALL